MDKIDRLGWAAGISFEVFGLKIGIRVRDPLVLDSLLMTVPSGWTHLESGVVDRLYSVVTPTVTRSNVRHLYVLYADHARSARTDRFESLVASLESDLDSHIAANSQDRLFVHAGAVRWRNHTVLMPGRSQAGKTTLVAEFLKSGAAYYSDDFAAIDHSGCLHTYPRELSIRVQNGTSQRVRAEEFGAVSAEPGPVTMVLITEYSEHASWNPKPISRGQGILRLLENTPSARKQPGFALEVLRNAVARAEVHDGSRGDKEQTVTRILNYLGGRSLA